MELKVVLCIVLLAATFLSTQAEFYFNHVPPKENELSGLKLKCIPGRTIIRIEQEKDDDDDNDDAESGSDDNNKVDGDEDDNDNGNGGGSNGDGNENSKGGGDEDSKRDSNEDVKGGSKADEKEDGDRDGNGNQKADGDGSAKEDGENEVDNKSSQITIQNTKSVDDTRRTHMNAVPKEGESCRICVCSVEGKDEYCSKRPAKNVNECIRMATITKEYKKNIPYNHDRILAYNIRRDYIWHKDEIPYEATAKCRRGISYYTNSMTAMDSDIEVPSDVESLLDYSNRSVCFYCICAVDGTSSGCMERDVWFCNYYRAVNQPLYSRNYYRELFQQDRPSYFRQLSYRLRRTMDDGIYDLLDTVGSGQKSSSSFECTPYVSEYTDCTAENRCTGCTRCRCSGEGQWVCKNVHECFKRKPRYQGNTIDNAIDILKYELADKKITLPKITKIRTEKSKKNLLLDDSDDIEKKIASFLRKKRSVSNGHDKNKNTSNNSVKFYHTVDELNEDTLKNTNISGRIIAQKVEPQNLPKLSRRTAILSDKNASQLNSLHIEYNNPHEYDHHLRDNMIEIQNHNIDKFYSLGEQKINEIINQSRNYKGKDKDLSKIVVNELKSGNEVLGDKNSPIISNITFTPENDTSRSVVFIAGTLLNQLWKLEKDSDLSTEAEILKHEKIADLLDLFKEPHTMKQETFIKEALAKITEAISRNKNLKNISLCAEIEQVKNKLEDSHSSVEDLKLNNEHSSNVEPTRVESSLVEKINKKHKVPCLAVSNIENTINLIKKLEQVQKSLSSLKNKEKISVQQKSVRSKPGTSLSTTDLETKSKGPISTFEKLLNTMTKSLVPNYEENQELYGNQNHFNTKFKNLFNIDLGNVNLTDKDKLLLNYLQKIEKYPNCWSENSHKSSKSTRNIEGSILLNLSEFFKVKSWLDLMKMVRDEKPHELRRFPVTTETLLNKTAESEKKHPTVAINNSNKSLNIKEKLKTHLKTIIDDLIELKKEKGMVIKNSDIKIADALPCIYRILNDDKKSENQILTKKRNINHATAAEKIMNVLSILKKESKNNSQSNILTRRQMISSEQSPKPASAVVWERVLTNLPTQDITRRALNGNISETFEEIQKSIDYVESTDSDLYKKYVITTEVPATDRLMLLKTIYKDITQYADILQNIQSNFDDVLTISHDKFKNIKDFIENSGIEIKLSNDITQNLKKTEMNKVNASLNKISSKQQALMTAEGYVLNNKNIKMKVTRDEVLRHLIKSRVGLYLTIREAKGDNLDDDMNYKVAKKVLSYLENGNYKLAKELYKIFVSQRQQSTGDVDAEKIKTLPNDDRIMNTRHTELLAMKQPLIQFEDPGANKKSQDNLLKLLLSSTKNLNASE